MNVKELLRYIQRTNPGMTEEKLIEEISKSAYSSIALLITFENKKNIAK